MLLSFILLVLLHVKLHKPDDRAAAFFECIVVWNLWSFALIEVLSSAKLLTMQALIVGWGSLDLVLFVLIIYEWHCGKRISGLIAEIKDAACHNKLLWLTGLIVLTLAFLTVSYNWDSMTYHLPRMMQWVQNKSVAHYAANDVRQLASPVLAEFVNVQVYLLYGQRDVFWNLLQAVSYLINAWIVYKIAVKIGTDRKYAYLSALLFMTMPIAFSEALNTQVDLFASLWLLIFVYYYIDLLEVDKLTADRETVRKCLMMGACVSLGYLAKPSVDVGMAVLLLGLLIRCIRRRDLWGKVILKLVVCVIPIVLFPLIPEWVRNYHTFSALGDSAAGNEQLVGTLAPNYVFINFIKNFAQNLSNKYLYDSDEWMAKVVMIAANVLRVDINALSISANGQAYAMSEVPAYNHDSASNPIVLIVATLCFIWYLLKDRKTRNAGNNYTLYSMVSFVIFCVLVRWSPFVSRFMLSYLAVLCPMIGYQIQRISHESKAEWLRTAVVPIIWFLCLTELFSLTRYHQEKWHEEASVRPVGYFAHNRAIWTEYETVFEWLNENGYDTLGIKIGSMNYEYPMWVMTNGPDIRIENVLVQNASGVYEDMTYIPACVIMDAGRAVDATITVHEQSYEKAPEFINNEHIAVYVRE